jgi:hypothetical protein
MEVNHPNTPQRQSQVICCAPDGNSKSYAAHPAANPTHALHTRRPTEVTHSAPGGNSGHAFRSNRRRAFFAERASALARFSANRRSSAILTNSRSSVESSGQTAIPALTISLID